MESQASKSWVKKMQYFEGKLKASSRCLLTMTKRNKETALSLEIPGAQLLGRRKFWALKMVAIFWRVRENGTGPDRWEEESQLV